MKNALFLFYIALFSLLSKIAFAQNVTIANGGSQNISGNIDSLALGTNATATINDDTTVSGNVSGTGNIDNSFGSNLTIGSSKTLNIGGDLGVSTENEIDIVTISSGATLNMTSSSAKEINVRNIQLNSGTINFGDSNTNIDLEFFIFNSGSSTVDLGRGSHTMNLSSREFIDTINDTIKTTVTASGNGIQAGNLSSENDLTLDAKNLYIETSLLTIDSESSEALVLSGQRTNGQAPSSIDVNGTGSNRSGDILFSARIDENNQKTYVIATRSPLAISTNLNDKTPEGSSIINSINNIANTNYNSLTGELATLRRYLNNSSVSNSAKNSALKTLHANNNGINQNNINLIGNTANIIRNRIRFSQKINFNDFEQKKYRLVNKNNKEIAQEKEQYANNQANMHDFIYDIEKAQENKNFLWGQFFNGNAEQKEKSSFTGYNSDYSGFTIGADRKISENRLVGVAASYIRSKVNSVDNLQESDIDSYQLNIYGEQLLLDKKLFIDGLAGITKSRYDSTRFIPVVNKVAAAKYDGETYFGKISTGYMKNISDEITITPEFGTTYAYNSLDNYSESGAGTLNLFVQNEDSEMLEIEPAISISHKSKINSRKIANFKIPELIIHPKLRLSYGYDLIGNAQTSISNFIGQNSRFTTQSSKVDRATKRVNFGLGIYNKESISIALNYVLEFKTAFKSQTGFIKLKYGF